MLAAAAAWDELAAALYATASSYSSEIAGLTNGWVGPASASMATAAAPYVSWMNATAAQAEQAGLQAKAAVAAYEAAFAMTVPPPVIAANRALLMALVASNYLGQNAPAIAATEDHYMQMWAQDAAAMYGYAGASAAASTLPSFTPPAQTTDPAGLAGQAAAVAQAAGTSAATHAQTTVSSVTSAAPHALSSASPYVSMTSSSGSVAGTTVELSHALGSMLEAASSPASALAHTIGNEAKAVGSALGAGSGALNSGGLAGLGSAGSVAAGLGRAGTIGALSVPHAWAAAAPSLSSTASALPGTFGSGAVPALEAAHPGGLFGAPLTHMAGRGGMGTPAAATPRFDLRPVVVQRPVAAG